MVKGSPIRPRPFRPPGCGHSRFGQTAGVLLSMESSSQASRVAERSFPHLVERCPRPAFGEKEVDRPRLRHPGRVPLRQSYESRVMTSV